jgi:hypothetical protein
MVAAACASGPGRSRAILTRFLPLEHQIRVGLYSPSLAKEGYLVGGQTRYDALLGRLEELGSVLVAYSGGVDSTLLAFCAHAVLGDRCKAVLAASDTYPEVEIIGARDLAAILGFNLIEVETYEMADPRFARNTPDRCYYCKTELFELLGRVAEVHGRSMSPTEAMLTIG